jgi:hypothetical protein
MRQPAAFLFQRVGDDALHLGGGIVKQDLMVTSAVSAELLDPNADFRLAHQERAALLSALRRVAGVTGGLRPAHAAGHGLTESLLPVGQADDGRSGGWHGRHGGAFSGG